MREVARLRGWRSALLVPLLRDHKPVGLISVTRAEPGPFADHHVQLLETFADQAVIAIENTRLFNEVQARTVELSEALEQQTATAEVLGVISSSAGDLAPVFDKMLENATRVCGAEFGSMVMVEGDTRRNVAIFNGPPAFVEARAGVVGRIHPRSSIAAAIRTRQVVQVEDLRNSPAYLEGDPPAVQLTELGGARTIVVVPMLREDEVIGLITVYRQEVRPFGDKQIELLTNFARQAVIAIENARLLRELRQRTDDLSESLQQQTATSEVLQVISSSPGDLAPVFDKMLENATRVCGAEFGSMTLVEGDTQRQAALYNAPPAFAAVRKDNVLPIHPRSSIADAIRTRQAVQVEDLRSFPSYLEGNPATVQLVELGGARTLVVVPMLRDDEVIGAITVFRQEVRPFGGKQVELLTNFARQAVIAIENARLLRELRQRTDDLSEALTHQTGSSNILRVIASSPTDVGPALKAIVESACEICDAYDAVVYLKGGSDLVFAAHHGSIPIDVDRWPINRQWVTGRALVDKATQHVHDLRGPEGDGFPEARELARPHGQRTVLSVPLLSEGEAIGVISLRRVEVQPFNDKQIELLKSFADQAVIAISNVRLFEEVQAKTHELTEALVYQTGSSNILKVIASSPTDVEPALKAIVESACEICDANDAAVFLRQGDDLVFSAHHGPVPVGWQKLPINRRWISGRVVIDKVALHIQDVPGSEADDFPEGRELMRRDGVRTILSVPLLRENEAIGTIVLRRIEAQLFNDKQIELLKSFADQAVIAISNVRLFEEVQAKTRELTEALVYQTGSSNILKVIASSPTDVGPALQAIVESACEICDANDAVALMKDGDDVHISAHHGTIPVSFEGRRISRQWVTGRALVDKATLHIADLLGPEGDEFTESKEILRKEGYRTVLSVPLLREGEAIGVICLRRTEVHPFNDKQIELLKSFADQAVIAISNVRLFEEVQAKTRDLTESLQFQTASADVLKVISRSPDTLQPVLDVIVQTSRELCSALTSVIFLLREDRFHAVATDIDRNFPGSDETLRRIETFRKNPISPDQAGSILARVMHAKCTVHVPNTEEDAEAGLGGPMDAGGPKALLCVPLMQDDRIIGAITLRQSHLSPFTRRQIEAVESFADQAVIAISNVNLFEQVQQRTRELTRSLHDLRTAQDRLIQTEKLASLGQLTAGIAHEIKNPLNFVNNFSALSVELTDELNQVLKQAELAQKLRDEVDELTKLLKDNLSKVVQHGKRADSIVKNMLLHSREGSGEHRPADVNALVEESLNLAYHGARAEKPQFNVTLQRDFDPQAGTVEVFPQEITRVLLNLISNGFYAVTKRKADNGGADFEPLVTATTRGGDDHVEICIRDNGTGIPPEVKAKMFNPFFTTKPAGEGTGLGLSMSHDIIVKQHGGSIDVETEPGAFTEFRLVLPRLSRAAGKDGGP